MILSAWRRPWVVVALTAILLAGAVAWAVFLVGNALPPRRVVMTTGPERGAYRDLGEKYRQVLVKPGRGNIGRRPSSKGVQTGFKGCSRTLLDAR
jgi:hypothetical protein